MIVKIVNDHFRCEFAKSRMCIRDANSRALALSRQAASPPCWSKSEPSLAVSCSKEYGGDTPRIFLRQLRHPRLSRSHLQQRRVGGRFSILRPTEKRSRNLRREVFEHVKYKKCACSTCRRPMFCSVEELSSRNANAEQREP